MDFRMRDRSLSGWVFINFRHFEYRDTRVAKLNFYQSFVDHADKNNLIFTVLIL